MGSNPARGMNVCYMLLGRGLYDELITRLEDSYRLWWCHRTQNLADRYVKAKEPRLDINMYITSRCASITEADRRMLCIVARQPSILVYFNRNCQIYDKTLL